MRARTFTSFSLAVLFCGTVAFGQTPATPPVDIYADFVGTWVGSDHYLKNGVEADVALRIVITETKKHDALLWNYTYGEKGQRGFDHATRHVKLDPAKEEMKLRWSDDSGPGDDLYKTTGLDRFAASGLGTFSAARKTMEDGKELIYICEFQLEQDSFHYHWSTGAVGQPFTVISIFSLKRQMPSLPSPAP